MNDFAIPDQLESYNKLIKNFEEIGFEYKKIGLWERFKLFPKNYDSKNDRYLVGWTGGSGLHLHGPKTGDAFVKSPNLLHLNFSENSAAKFIKVEENIWLVHDSRIATKDGRNNPSANDSILINNRKFYLVTKINDANVFENIIEFHESRAFLTIGGIDNLPYTENRKTYKGQNGGAIEGFPRDSSDVFPQHAPLVEALRKAIPEEWMTINNNLISPDLYIGNKKRNILFEVKPSYDFTNLCHAVGQLKVYSKLLDNPELVYVSYGLPLEVYPEVKNILDNFKIHFVKVTDLDENGEAFEFEDLTEILNPFNS